MGASLQARLSRWFAVQTLVGLSLVSLGTYGAIRWSFEQKRDDEFVQHTEIVEQVMHNAVGNPDLEAFRVDMDNHFHTHADAEVTITDTRGRILFTSEVRASGKGWETRRITRPDFVLAGEPLVLTLTLDVGNDGTLLRRLAITLAAAAMLGTIIISVTGTLLVRRGLRPLRQLAEQTAASGPDKPGRRISNAPYAAELYPWISQFNALLVRVEAAYAQLEAFNADVAHELRTPLSNMIAQIDVELGRDRSAEELREALASQLEEAVRLNAIVNDMLFLSRADRGAKARRGPPESLAAQVHAVAEFQEAVLEDASLTVAVQGEAVIPMDTGLLRRAISNLISNAQRHARRGSCIRVLIEQEGICTYLAVENEGEPIAAEAIPRVFERFYRADPSRARSADHHGLGLAIVAAIARMHDGDTFAESSGGRTRIGLTLLVPADAG